MASPFDFVMGLFTLNTDALMYFGVFVTLFKFVYTTYVEHPKTYAETNSVVAIMKTHHFPMYLVMRTQYVKRITQLYSPDPPSPEVYVALCTSPLFPSSAAETLFQAAEDGGDPSKQRALAKRLLLRYMAGVEEGEDTTPICESM